MKYKILFSLSSVLLFAPTAFASMTFSPVAPQPIGTSINITCTVGNWVAMADSMGSVTMNALCTSAFSAPYWYTAAQTFTFYECDSTVSGSTCSSTDMFYNPSFDLGMVSSATYEFTGGSMSSCSPPEVDHGSVASYPTCTVTCDSGYTLSGSACFANSSSAFLAQLASATSTFQATTGFDIDGVVRWAGDNLIKLFIGSGLAMLFYLRGWIVALVMIGAIVYFAYRAFRFFRH